MEKRKNKRNMRLVVSSFDSTARSREERNAARLTRSRSTVDPRVR